MSRVKALRGMVLPALMLPLLGCSSTGVTTPTNTFTSEYFSAALTPGSEVPTASGNAAGTTNLGTASATTIAYSASGSNLSNVTGVFVYGGASGANGTKEVTLCTTTCTSASTSTTASIAPSGTFDSTKVTGVTWQAFLTQLRTGAAYVQVTTSGAPNGAVRGQFGTSSSPPNDPFFVLSPTAP